MVSRARRTHVQLIRAQHDSEEAVLEQPLFFLAGRAMETTRRRVVRCQTTHCADGIAAALVLVSVLSKFYFHTVGIQGLLQGVGNWQAYSTSTVSSLDNYF